MTTYGYARVSTDGQTVAAQVAELAAAGCAKVYAETASGTKTNRAELAKVLKRLESGDVLMITRLVAGSVHQGFAQRPAYAECAPGQHRGSAAPAV